MSNPSDTDIAWLAGLLEGEGYFGVNKGTGRRDGHIRRSCIRVSLFMVDEDVVQRARTVAAVPSLVATRHAGQKRQTGYVWTASGGDAERVMRLVRPHMGKRRAAKIDEILSAPPGTYSHQPRPKEAA